MIQLKDNSSHKLCDYKDFKDLITPYAHKSLQKLIDTNDDLMIFSSDKYLDELHKLSLWNIRDDQIHTSNLMGFIGLKKDDKYCSVKIFSRFTKKNEGDLNNEKDFFLHYMLQKVFLGQTINLELGTNESDSFWEFYYYLFPYYLNKALNTGLYKEYVHKKYNDINIRGAIDVKRHIQKNLPFQGRIAYNTREYSYNNRITQLIRHTIEHISRHKFGKSILGSSITIKEHASQIEHLTHDFHHNNKSYVLLKAHDKITNPYWSDYELLRKLCLKILNQDQLSFEKDQDTVHGILFDGAWLWEEYLATILVKEEFVHPDNHKKTGYIYLANNSALKRYPDFYCEQRKLVLDAKYKHPHEDHRDDTHQIISYMYRLQSEKGSLVYPSQESHSKEYGLLGHGNKTSKLSHKVLLIAEAVENYSKFCKDMQNNEHDFLKNL